MAKLRETLGDSASSPKYVETIAKRGYRFLALVEKVEHAAPLPSASTPVADSPPSQGASASAPLQSAPTTQTSATPQALPETVSGDKDLAVTELPRASRKTSRTLFVLSQVMYMAFYVSALFRLDRLHQAAEMAWHSWGQIAFVAYALTALVGLVVRLYLISATALDYHLLGKKFRILFPALFILDMLWALAPFLLTDRIGIGLALGSTAALLYMPFAQRTLVKMIEA